MCHRILLLIVSSLSCYFNALISGHPEGKGGLPRGISGYSVICTTTFTNPPIQNQNCLTKSY